MLRLIGLLTLALLVLGPSLDNAGMLGHGGLLAELVDVEQRTIIAMLRAVHLEPWEF